MVKLYSYQERGVEHIKRHNRCALWMECGLGKTLTVITALKELPKPALVVAPKRVIDHTWPDELRKWSDFTHTKLTGTPKQRLEALQQQTDVHLINFELFTWLVGELKSWPYPTVIIDESSRVKNRATKVFKAMRKVCRNWRHHIQLTGTPSPNGLIDLWSQLYLLDAGQRLGKTLTAFRERWFDSDYMGWSYEPKVNAQKEIEARCADICLSMTADDYLNLPEKIVTDISIDLSPAAKKAYKALKTEMVLSLQDTDITAVSAATLANKLLQITSGSVYDEEGNAITLHSQKLDAIDDILDAEPTIIVYQYRSEVTRLKDKYPQAVDIRTDKTAVERWNRGGIPILLIHPASSGHGLNLQHGGRKIIWMTPTWNLEHYIQTNARLYRNGQTKPVMIYRLLATNTIDEKVATAIEAKQDVQSMLLEALKI